MIVDIIAIIKRSRYFKTIHIYKSWNENIKRPAREKLQRQSFLKDYVAVSLKEENSLFIKWHIRI